MNFMFNFKIVNGVIVLKVLKSLRSEHGAISNSFIKTCIDNTWKIAIQNQAFIRYSIQVIC